MKPAYILVPAGLLLTTGAVLYGKEYLQRQQGYLQNTSVRFAGLQILSNDVAVSEIKAKVFLAIRNHSDFTITIRSQHVDVFQNNERIHRFESEEPLTIHANGENVIGIPVTIKIKNTLPGILNAFAALPGLESMSIRVKGRLNILSSGIYLNNFNFEIEKSVKDLFMGFKANFSELEAFDFN